MTRQDARELLTRIGTRVNTTSRFLQPTTEGGTLDAITVFDAIRAVTNPPMSEEEFNAMAEEGK